MKTTLLDLETEPDRQLIKSLPSPLLALSLTEPWCWAMMWAGKTVENRERSTNVRGTVAIHISKRMLVNYYEEAKQFIEKISGIQVPPRGRLTLGAIIGLIDIVDCVWGGGRRQRSKKTMEPDWPRKSQRSK